jgi:hypothetical protein
MNMPASALKKTGMPAATGLFEQITDFFASHSAHSVPEMVPKRLDASFKALRAAPYDEFAAVRMVLEEMTERMNEMADAQTRDVQHSAKNAATRESLKVKEILAKARAAVVDPAPDGEAARDNAEYIEAMRRASAAALQHRIHTKELLPPRAFQDALGIRKQSVNEAIKSHRMFALMGPGGEFYYPAFYADDMLDRRSLEKVTKALGTIPGASKYFFFTSKSTMLGEMTPLEALKKGRLQDVLVAATAFNER